jgi:hypothetical protein
LYIGHNLAVGETGGWCDSVSLYVVEYQSHTSD